MDKSGALHMVVCSYLIGGVKKKQEGVQAKYSAWSPSFVSAAWSR